MPDVGQWLKANSAHVPGHSERTGSAMGRTLLKVTLLEDRSLPTAGNPLITGLWPAVPTGITAAGPIAIQNTPSTSNVVVGSLPGHPGRLAIYNNGTLLHSTDPFAGFTGGVRVATGDVNGDGTDDIAVSPGDGGGPRVRIYDGKTFGTLADFFAIESTFRGGYYVSLGDINGDEHADVVGMAGEGGGPRTTVLSGQQLLSGQLVVLANFFAYEPQLRNGGMTASADVDGDGYDEVFTAPGLGGGPRVRVFDGRALTNGAFSTFADFFAADPNSRYGVNIAAGSLGYPCGAPVLVTTPRIGDPDTWLRVFDPHGGTQLATSGFPASPMDSVFAAIQPARSTTERPKIVASAWLPTGDAVLDYTAEGYDYVFHGCYVDPVVPPVPPPPPPPPAADLHITKVASNQNVTVGQPVTFTVTVRNDGPSAATGTVISDPLPAGFLSQSITTSSGAYNAITGQWSVGDMNNGSSATMTITGSIFVPGTITNTATVTSAVGDPDPLDNTSSATVTAVPQPPPPPPPAPTLIPLSATGLHYLAAPGTFTPISDVNVGNTTTSPVVVHRLVFTLTTGFWSNVTNVKLQLLGSLSSEPGMGSISIDSLGTTLTVSNIAYTLTTGVVQLRLSGDVLSTVQVGTVTAWGYAS